MGLGLGLGSGLGSDLGLGLGLGVARPRLVQEAAGLVVVFVCLLELNRWRVVVVEAVECVGIGHDAR